MSDTNDSCPECGGHGVCVCTACDDEHVCPECDGTGVLEELNDVDEEDGDRG